MSTSGFHLDTIVDVLKTIAEPTRLRILKLLADGDLTVSELTGILGQSQPRVSRHLKLMLDARLIRRQQEGSWALFRLSRDPVGDGEGGARSARAGRAPPAGKPTPALDKRGIMMPPPRRSVPRRAP